MAVRFYLSPLVGTGVGGDTYRARAQDRYREVCIRVGEVALQASPAKFSALIPSDSVGAPREPWTICEIDLPDFAELDADTELALLSRRTSLDALPTAATDAALTKFGLSRDGADATLLQVTRRVMRLLEQTAEVR